jgi:hypothetical protein
MKTLIIEHVIVLFTLFFTNGNTYGQQLKVVYGDRLYYQRGGNLFEIKRVKDGSSFRGYDIVDSLHIFVAYDPETSAEASTIISVYDVGKQREEIMGELGGTGESYFVYNKEADLVAFNWSEGIYVFKLPNLKKELTNNTGLKLVVRCDDCYLPFWIDMKRIGYKCFENGKPVTKYHEIKK